MAGENRQGFIKLHRRVFSHWLWDEVREITKFEAFIDLLQLAAFEPTKRVVSGRVIEVPKGGIAASERFLSTRWKWSRTKVRHFLEMLESDGMAKQEKDQGNTVIILCNYGVWNPSETTKNTTEAPEEDQGETTERPNIRTIRRGSHTHTDEIGVLIPTIEEVKAYAKSSMIGITEDCAVKFWNDHDCIGWLHKGMPIRKWRPLLDNFARSWNLNERTGRPGKHEQQKLDLKNQKGVKPW